MAECARHRGGTFVGWAAPGADAEAEALLAADPGELVRILAAPARPAAASDGRAVPGLRPLAGAPGRMRLRPVRRGGLLGPLWAGRVPSPRRALRELSLTADLYAEGLPVPRPLLVLARRSGVLWRVALASEQIDDALDGRAALDGPRPELRDARARRIGALLRALHDAGVRHGDPHVGNFLLDARDDRGWVVDLDRAVRAGPLSEAQRARQRRRLARSLHKHRLDAALPALEAGYRAPAAPLSPVPARRAGAPRASPGARPPPAPRSRA